MAWCWHPVCDRHAALGNVVSAVRAGGECKIGDRGPAGGQMRVGILPEWAGGASVPAAKQNSTSYPSLLVTEAGPGTFPLFAISVTLVLVLYSG